MEPVNSIRGWIRFMLTQYLKAALAGARFEEIGDEQPWYGEIPECQGVWATGRNREDCEAELVEVLEEWLFFRIHRHLPLPVIRVSGS